MNSEKPSQTASTAAAARAAHLLVDAEPHIFADTLAESLLGERADELLAYHRLQGEHPILAGARAQVVCRSRVTEDLVGGFDRYVLLGAGLDTFAYRRNEVEVVEIDRPATQNWKRQALEKAGISATATYLGSVADLKDAGRTLVSWLGVTMYLTSAELDTTLAALPPCELVVDHMLPEGLRDAAGDAYVAGVAPVAAGQGEPWRSFLSPDDMAALLDRHGFEVVRHHRQRDVPGMLDRTDALRPSDLSVITHARHRLS
ncbi:class I SAM-dependent methyltransferase [Actinophytocola oryzae]|uniref:Methyltransferase (TIGR00027 family) n=1 Tax=Actinophytocola oryzae TaxID=502181 RepID=A0A4R7UT78_9PSEU|nr:class I SAM-dependent methyltransferase [Actinophytocola oryzae]TDV39819.1 methyltransferase (TIGR00027 family) [Actinophytocola oryzae]